MKKQTGILTTLAALGLAIALPAAMAWYYDVFVNWQPNVYPIAVTAVILGNILLTLLTLWARGERKALPLAWKTALSAAVFIAVLIGISGLINNALQLGARLAANAAVPLCAAQCLVLFALLLRKLRKPAVAVCLAASFLLSSFFMIGAPWYMKERYKAPIPALPEGRFAPMPALGEVDFTVPIDGSIEEVRDLIREARANGNDRHFTVLIEDGEYSITQILFDGRDHDTIYRSRDGGVVLNGGMRLPAEQFGPVRDESMAARFSKKALEHIKAIDLAQLGITAEDWGELDVFGGTPSCELFYNNTRCTLARWPDKDQWIKTGQVLDHGDSPSDDRANPWDYLWDLPAEYTRGATILMDRKTAARAAAWQDGPDIWVYGFFQYDWAEFKTRAASFDQAAGSFTTELPYDSGYRQGRDYYFFNVPEELDAPGEWYLDRESGWLYLYPPDDDLDSARIDLSLSTETLITGEGVANLSFVGLTLQGTRGHAMELRGDGITVSHCVLRCVGGDALQLHGYNNTASDNEVYRTGMAGIDISGGDAETLTPGNSRVVNNLVYNYSEVSAETWRGGVRVRGTGNLAAHNEIFNAPKEALLYGGSNNVIEYNLIHDVCLIADDVGAIYVSSGRDFVGTYGTVIRNNVIYNIGSGGHKPSGIYLDDGTSGLTVANNLLVNVPDTGLLLGGGRDLTVTGNVIVNAGAPVSYDERTRDGVVNEDSWFRCRSGPDGDLLGVLLGSYWQAAAWKEAFPQLAAVEYDYGNIDTPMFVFNPANSIVTGNVYVGQNEPRYDESVPRFSEIGPNEEYGVLRTRNYRNLPGFENIEIEKIGRTGGTP